MFPPKHHHKHPPQFSHVSVPSCIRTFLFQRFKNCDATTFDTASAIRCTPDTRSRQGRHPVSAVTRAFGSRRDKSGIRRSESNQANVFIRKRPRLDDCTASRVLGVVSASTRTCCCFQPRFSFSSRPSDCDRGRRWDRVHPRLLL
jgi:hypothetical protein